MSWKVTILEMPPRGQGRLGHSLVLRVYVGNTPEWAGKTAIECHIRGRKGKHPREGGEDWTNAEGAIYDMETPPRAGGEDLHSSAIWVSQMETPPPGGESACTALSILYP